MIYFILFGNLPLFGSKIILLILLLAGFVMLQLDILFIFIPDFFVFYQGLKQYKFKLWNMVSIIINILLYSIFISKYYLRNGAPFYSDNLKRYIGMGFKFAFTHLGNSPTDLLISSRLILSVAVLLFLLYKSIMIFIVNDKPTNEN